MVIAFFGSGSVDRQALRTLLEADGYHIRLLGGHPVKEKLGKLLEGVALLLVLPGQNPERLEGFLDRMRSTPATAALPILSLKTSLDKVQQDGQQNHVVLAWPCKLQVLKEHIETLIQNSSKC